MKVPSRIFFSFLVLVPTLFAVNSCKKASTSESKQIGSNWYSAQSPSSLPTTCQCECALKQAGQVNAATVQAKITKMGIEPNVCLDAALEVRQKLLRRIFASSGAVEPEVKIAESCLKGLVCNTKTTAGKAATWTEKETQGTGISYDYAGFQTVAGIDISISRNKIDNLPEGVIPIPQVYTDDIGTLNQRYYKYVGVRNWRTAP